MKRLVLRQISSLVKQTQLPRRKTPTAPSFCSAATANKLDFTNFQMVFAGVSSSRLLNGYLVLTMCKFPVLVNQGEKLLALSRKVLGTQLTNMVVKKTFYRHFCAGETTSEVGKAVALLKEKNVTPILDYSVESEVNENGQTAPPFEVFDINLKNKLKSIRNSANLAPGSFVAFKFTSIIRPVVLVEMSKLFKIHDVKLPSTPGDDFLGNWKLALDSPDAAEFFEKYKEDIDYFIESMDSVVNNITQNDLKLLIDAEHFCVQSSVDLICALLQHKYNQKSVYIYNTFQTYLKQSAGTLHKFIDHAESQNYKLGVKLVRGAYVEYERKEAKRLGYPSPIHDSFEDTSNNFDTLAIHLLDKFGSKNCSVVYASHNKDSLSLIANHLKEKKIDDSAIYFAQLFGMSDNLTYTLTQHGYKTLKLVPYGEIDEVMPYLIRRAQENSGMIAKTQQERDLMFSELKRRLYSQDTKA